MDQNKMLDQIEAVFGGMSTQEIKDFIKETKARAAAVRQANSKKARKDETRRLILDGKLLSHLVAQNIISAQIVSEEREKFLVYNKDRELFGLFHVVEPQKRRRGRPKNVVDVEYSVSDVATTTEAAEEMESEVL